MQSHCLNKPVLFGSLTRQHIPLDSKHLARGRRDKTVNLARVLIHLPRIEHALQPTRLAGQLKQTLPLVLGKEGLLERCAGGVLLAALLLPVVDLLLLPAQNALVILEVVDLGIMGFNAVQKQVAVLLQAWIDAERQILEVGGEGCRFGERAGLQST